VLTILFALIAESAIVIILQLASVFLGSFRFFLVQELKDNIKAKQIIKYLIFIS